jgi:hypothetical protein
MITSKMIDEATWAAWHEFRYPRPALDEPTDAFKRAIRTAIETAEALQAKERR